MESSLVFFANNIIGGKGWPYILEAIFFLLAAASFTLFQKNRAAFFSYFACAVIALCVARAIAFTLLLHWLWSRSVPGKYFLPPYQPISYFVGYSFTHFYFSLLLALTATLGISFIFLFLKKYRNNTFQPGDIALYICCCMIIRWPLLLPYTIAVFASAALFLAINRYIIKGRHVVFLSRYFLFAAIPFIFFGNLMIQVFHLQSLLLPL